MMKVLLYAGLYDNFGVGNLLRMYYLYLYLVNSSEINRLVFTSNNAEKARRIIATIGESSCIEELNVCDSYDIIVYDYYCIDDRLLCNLRSCSKRIIALDFQEYEKNDIDVIINLYTHRKKETGSFKGHIYEGIKYAILKDEILNSRKKQVDIPEGLPGVLVTFGGEDPNSNTLKVMEHIDIKKANFKVLLGPLNRDRDEIYRKYSEYVNVMPSVPHIGKLISESDIVICGGGTTLMEAMYIGNPIIAMPQNKFEVDFINYMKQSVPLFSIEDIKQLIIKCSDIEFREDIKRKYSAFIDGKGKERIKDLIMEVHDNEKGSSYRCR